MKAKVFNFVRGLSNGTPPRFQSYLKSLTLIFTLLLSVNMWGEKGDELYNSGSFATVSAHGYTQNKTFTLADKTWKSSVSQVASSVFYLGCNSNNAAKGILNNNSDFSAVVTALKAASSYYNTNYSSAHAYALLFDNSYSKVGSVTISWTGANNAGFMYIFGDTGSGYELLKSGSVENGSSVSGSLEYTTDAVGGITLSKLAFVYRPGANESSGATNKTLRMASVVIKEGEGAAPAAKHNVNWYVNGSVWKTTQVTEGASITLPTPNPTAPSTCSDKVFMGWVNESQKNYENPTVAPTYISNPKMGTGDVNYYAVFADVSESSTKFHKGTVDDLKDGRRTLLVEYTDKKAVNSSIVSTKYLGVTNVTISNDKITVASGANCVWNAYKSSEKYQFKQGNNYLNSTGNDLYCNSTSDMWTFASGGSGYTIKSTNGTKYLEYYSNYTEFTCYSPASSTPYYFHIYVSDMEGSNYTTSCCTPLAAPTNLSAGTPGATSATITWSAVANATGYEYKLGDGAWTAAGNLSQTITGLTPCNNYSVHVRAIYSGAGNYCAEGPEASVDFSTTGFTYTFIENHVSTTDENPSTTCDGDVMLEYVAESNYTLPTTITVEGASNYDWEDGVLLIEANDVTGNVTVTITAVANACPSYSFSYGEKGQAYTTLCFEQVGETNEWRIENFVFPDVSTNQVGYVGKQGYWYGSNLGSSGSKSADLYFADFPLALMQGVGGCPNTYTVGWSKDNSNGHNAIGALRIYTNYTDDNLYVGFIPNGYGMQYGTDGQDDWQNIAFTDQGNNAWMTDLVTLTSDMVSNGNFKYWVGLLKSGGGYTYSSSISNTATFNTMGSYCSNWSGTHWGASLSAYHAGDKGKFRIWVNSCNGNDTKNFVCHFVPFYQATFDAAGGTCDPVLPAEPVSAEESTANRTITLPTPTKTGYNFAGWNDGVSTVAAGTQVELTSNTSYTAQWTIKTTAIKLSRNSGTTDGSAAVTYGSATLTSITHVTYNTDTKQLKGYAVSGKPTQIVINANGELQANIDGYTNANHEWINENAEVTLVAQYNEGHTVTFSAPSGDKQRFVVTDQALGELPTDPGSCDTENGYTTFIGWSTVQNGTADAPSATLQGELVTAATVPTDNATYHAVWADGAQTADPVLEVTLDFSAESSTGVSAWGISTAKTYSTTETSYTYGGHTIKLAGDGNSSNGYYYNASNKQLLMGKGGCYMLLPIFDFKVSKIVATSPGGTVSGKVTWNIYVGENYVSDALTGCASGGTFIINEDYRTIGTQYKLAVTNDNNLQFKQLEIYSEASAATGYISTCCASTAVVTVTPTSSALALNIDGQATTTVHFEQTGAGSGRYNEPTITPAEGASLNWTSSYKIDPYDLTFTATKEGSYEVKGNFTETAAGCAKYGSATITVDANPIIAAMKDDAAINALAVNGVCGGEGDANSFVIKSRYLTNAQVTVTATTTAGSGTYKVSTNGTNYSTSVNFTGGQDALGEQTIYVRYETSSESETGTLAGNIAITSAGATTQNVTLSGTCTCSPRVTATMSNNNIVAVNGSWSAGLSEVALSAYNLTMNPDGADVTIKFESTNNNFKLKANTTSGEGVVAANLSFPVASGSDTWNQNIVVTYKPTAAGATETATITVEVIRTGGSKEYARTQFTVKGYSLPAEFVMATKVDGNWYTMTEVAAASGNTPCPGTQLVVDDATNPTIITGVADGYLPSITVFTPAIRPTVNTNAECVRFESKKKPGNFLRVPDDGTYLYFNSENSTSNSYWRMTPNPSVEGEFYIALPNNAYGRSLSAKDAETGKTTFGHFKQTTSWRLLPLSNEVHLCTRYIAPNVQVTKLTNGSNDVTLKVSSTNGEPETLGYEYSTDQTSWTAMSGTGTSATVTLTGLTKGTEYTYYVRGIVTDGTENCSGEKEVTFSPFNPIVTVTPSSLDLTCLAGETDTKGVNIDANADAVDWTIGANPITGANASMFSFNAGTSQVTFSPAIGTADGNYTATLTIKSQAGNVSANVTLTGTVVSKAAMVFGIEDMQNGMICEKQITYPATGIYVYLNNRSAVYSAGDGTTKANAPGQISNAVFIRDLSTGGADVQTGFSYGVDAGVAHFIIKQANLVYGHTYRISYYNDLANDGNGLFNAAGLGFADGYVDFVYSADCSKPTAILPCITSPTTAVANWEYADCDGNATVEVYTKTSNVVHDKSLKEACNNWGYAKRNKAAWGLVGTSNSGSYPAATWGWTLYQGGYTCVYSPEMSEISSSITSSTVVTVTVTMKNNRNYACTMDVYPVICASNPTNTNPTFTQKTAYFDQSTTKDIGSYSVPANANGETIEFTISGLESNYSLCFASRASQIALFVQNVKFEIKGKNSFKTLTPSCSAKEVEITGLSADTKYYYTVTNGGKTSNEIEFTTWADGASSVKFYNNEARTLSDEITSSDNILVLGGEQTTVYLEGTKVAGCEPVVSVSAGYRIEDHSTYNPSTGALGGYVVLTLADPTQTAGTLTVTDGAGGTTVRNIISSTCPAVFDVVEWFPTKLLIESSQAITTTSVQVGTDDAVVGTAGTATYGTNLYEVQTGDLTAKAGQAMSVSYTIEATTYAKVVTVPIILSRSTYATSGSVFGGLEAQSKYQENDLVVRDSATLTMDATIGTWNTFKNVTIYPKSKVVVPEGKTLKTSLITMRGGYDEIYKDGFYTMGYDEPQLYIGGTCSATQVNYEKRVDLDQMHGMSVPFAVEQTAISYLNGTSVKEGGNLFIDAYDGKKRADFAGTKSSWYYYDETENPLYRGVGYTVSGAPMIETQNYAILRFPMATGWTDAVPGSESVAELEVHAWGHDAGIRDNHKGWNCLGNPYLANFGKADDATFGGKLYVGQLVKTLDDKENWTGGYHWDGSTVRYVTIPHDDGRGFEQVRVQDAVLKPFRHFFVQVQTEGTLQFAKTDIQSSVVARLMNDEPEEIELGILMSNGQATDNCGLLIGDDFSEGYEMMSDLGKELGQAMAIYTITGEYKLAFNAMNEDYAKGYIPVGYLAPKAGEYTISFDNDRYDIAPSVEHIYLLENGAPVADLKSVDYDFETTAGTNDDRFALNIVFNHNIGTDLSGADSMDEMPVKIVHNDKMYILMRGKVYSTTGKFIKAIKK